VSFVDIVPHVLPYNIFIFLQWTGEASGHFSRHFVPDVQELAKIGVVMLGGLIVPQRRGKSMAAPPSDLLGAGTSRLVDVE